MKLVVALAVVITTIMVVYVLLLWTVGSYSDRQRFRRNQANFDRIMAWDKSLHAIGDKPTEEWLKWHRDLAFGNDPGPRPKFTQEVE